MPFILLMILLTAALIIASIKHHLRYTFYKPATACLRLRDFYDASDHKYNGYGLRIAIRNLPNTLIFPMLVLAAKNAVKADDGLRSELYLCIVYGKHMVAVRYLQGLRMADYENVKKLINKYPEIDLVLFCGEMNIGLVAYDAMTSSEYSKIGKKLKRANFREWAHTFQRFV